MTRIQILAVSFSLALLAFVVDMIRRRRLLERYSLPWLLTVGVLVILSAWPRLLDRVAPLLGIAYPPAVLFLGGLFLLVLLCLHFSLAISRLSERNRVLAQRLALLEEREACGGKPGAGRRLDPGEGGAYNDRDRGERGGRGC